jgi:transposase-like protein
MAKKLLTVQDFLRMFPDDDTCLAHLFHVRYGVDPQCPKCGEIGKFHRLSKMPAYTCNCGHHLHPMTGTPFLRTRTSLQKWFYAMFLFTTTRNGVAAKELQRQLGVTYKTAWRMAKEIRVYMAQVDGDETLGGPGRGIVEADKAFIGGYDRRGHDDKTVVLGMVERGGDVITRVVTDRSASTLTPIIKEFVEPGSRIATDTAKGFASLWQHGYRHATVNHAEKEYVRQSVHTNTIEAFWAMVKRTINGTHIWVSPKHLPKYLGEIEYRWNLRKRPELMFPLLLSSFLRS